jgi:hypothetical protein
MFYSTIGSALEKLEVQFSLSDVKHLNSETNIVSNSINDFFSLICSSTVQHSVLGDIKAE